MELLESPSPDSGGKITSFLSSRLTTFVVGAIIGTGLGYFAHTSEKRETAKEPISQQSLPQQAGKEEAPDTPDEGKQIQQALEDWNTAAFDYFVINSGLADKKEPSKCDEDDDICKDGVIARETFQRATTEVLEILEPYCKNNPSAESCLGVSRVFDTTNAMAEGDVKINLATLRFAQERYGKKTHTRPADAPKKAKATENANPQ